MAASTCRRTVLEGTSVKQSHCAVFASNADDEASAGYARISDAHDRQHGFIHTITSFPAFHYTGERKGRQAKGAQPAFGTNQVISIIIGAFGIISIVIAAVGTWICLRECVRDIIKIIKEK